MTRIEFYFNVADKLAQVADLCSRAVAKGRQLMVLTADDSMSEQLRQQLWSAAPTHFLPSMLPHEQGAHMSPIILDAQGEKLLQDDILINLQPNHPPFFSRFRYLVELVGNDEADKVAARARYKFYRDRGYQIKSSDARVK
jgi:DNA polymerase III subunit chi